MKTHMNNTEAFKIANDIVSHQQFLKHQQALHSNIKPVVVTKRKQEIKVTKNKKCQLNNNPNQHIHHLFNNLHSKKYKSTIDNKPTNYESNKAILADKIKRNKHQNFQKNQHQKQLANMHHRIQNCKNWEQRKKDNTDAIVNPTYFIKKENDVSKVTINDYCQKVLNKNRPKSSKISRPQKSTFAGIAEQKIQQKQHEKPLTFGTVPNYTKNRPQSAAYSTKKAHKQTSDELPSCTFKQILTYIVNNKIFKDVEIKVLYVRLCHKYGEDRVDLIWEDLMDELER